jgi:hypothetical protein
VLVVSRGNDERREPNDGIRKLLVAQGHVNANGREHAILVNRDLTKAPTTKATLVTSRIASQALREGATYKSPASIGTL